MSRSILLALSIALVVGVWIISGQFGPEPERAAVTTEEPKGQTNPEPQSVRVLESVAKEVPEIIRVFGRTEAERAVTVRVETAGSIASIVATEGHNLEEGAEIVRLDMEDRASVLRRAEGELGYRDKAFTAAEALSKKQFSSEVGLAEDKAAFEAARADVAAAKLDISRTRVRLPFSGVVDNIEVEPGDVVAVGDPIAYVADLDPIIVAIGISERDITHLSPGDSAMVNVVGHSPLPGFVRFVSRSASEETRTFRVEIAMGNPDLKIAEGLTAEVVLETERQFSHRITPSALVLNDEGRLGVMTVDSDDNATFKAARIIRDEVDGIWLTGLDVRERIIVTGQSFVADGDPVVPVVVGE